MAKVDIDHLLTYFMSYGRALNASGLEIILFGTATRTLRHWLKKEQALPEHHVEKVLTWARLRGYLSHIQYDPIV